jgi:hypothetical protein
MLWAGRRRKQTTSWQAATSAGTVAWPIVPVAPSTMTRFGLGEIGAEGGIALVIVTRAPRTTSILAAAEDELNSA